MPLSNKILNTLLDLNRKVQEYGNGLIKESKHQNIWLKNMETGKKLTEWSIKKYKLQFQSAPDYVFQRDIFYCELGFNVGQEQEGRRPVVILQNDAGNKAASHTIVAPITTFNNATIFEEDGKYYVKWVEEDGTNQSRQLYYYEIPFDLEAGYSKKIEGVINLSQIKTVSKKRLVVPNIAKITVDSKNKVDKAIFRLLNINTINKLEKEKVELKKRIRKLEQENHQLKK
ncbi:MULTISPECIES: type II toxin-antitoxin system PemK/MazF family toxin [Bacillus cereus group]|uniref:type II toxin-antitoxin system PemK/MazF family toxin n=1 Tax=Bacillus cereus group TaxID=86661 RepID=UPI000C28A97F|nr:MULTISPECIES: type II toxin-antitoxin system PemK/MazF family toxin [Bacillus cereus group]MCC2420463.1 type II toxin-antitoxin system PemK/MazF family toxin [Bacillus wiedmannii]